MELSIRLPKIKSTPYPLFWILLTSLKAQTSTQSLTSEQVITISKWPQVMSGKWFFTLNTAHSNFSSCPWMGLTNFPETFQHFMNNIFQDMANVFVIVYLNDILIFSKDIKEHRHHLRKVLVRLWKYHLWVKPEKLIFHLTWVEFLDSLQEECPWTKPNPPQYSHGQLPIT